MRINKVTLTPVGADLSCTSPIMQFNTITGISVGADLSCTPPIYRPPVTVHDIPLILLNCIIGLRWVFYSLPILITFIISIMNVTMLKHGL